MLREELMKMLDGREDDMIALRRHFHEHPELSFDEKETAAFIARFYENKSVGTNERRERLWHHRHDQRK